MRKLHIPLLLLLIFAALALPVSAQDEALPDFIVHTECSQDLTGQQVPIYHFGDLSGSYAFITQPLLAGLSDAIAYFNAHGGVCGADLVSEVGAHYRDTEGNPDNVQPTYDYFKTLDPKPDLLVLYASGDSERLRAQVAEDEIPVLISAGSVEGLYGPEGNEPGWIYATNPLYADQLGAFCDYVAANPEIYPEPMIGYIGWGGPVAAFGKAAYTPETLAYCASVGVPIVEPDEAFLPLPTVDLTNNIRNLVDAGANIIYTNSLATGPFLVAKFVSDLYGTDVKVAGVNWALDTTVGLLSAGAVGADGLPVVNGLVGSLPFRWWSEVSHPAIALIREQAELNERQLPVQNIAYLLGWSLVDTYIELYAQTVNRVGSLDAVDGPAIKETIESLVYEPLGGFSTFDFEGGSIRAAKGNRMGQMFFLNAAMNGPATSGEDALKIPRDDGTVLFVPLIVPLTEFAPAPDLKPGGVSVPQE